MTALRILLIDDDAIIAMALADVLTGMGHEVCEIAETESDAVAAADRCKPDFMIADANLYEGSGISAVAKILVGGFVPHLFMTGDPDKVQGSVAGAIILRKPFTINDLTSAMARSRQLSV